MSYLVTRLVRAVRLPKAMVNRPAAKGVLLALADDCDDDGRGAFTSVATMAREAEVGLRTVDAHLLALSAAGLIVEQAPPKQHRPRTWMLNLASISALLDPQAVATLSDSDQQLVATLTPPQPVENSRSPVEISESESQAVATLKPSGADCSNPDTQSGKPDTQRVATERYELNTKDRTARQTAPRFPDLTRSPNGPNAAPIKKIAFVLMDEQPELEDPSRRADLVEAIKCRCARDRIDYGRDPGVSFRVTHEAAEFAQVVRARNRATRQRLGVMAAS